MSKWTSVEDKLPEYGEPILLVIKGVVQNVTYMLDGCDDTPDWFEPYHFDSDDNCKLWRNQAGFRMTIPEPPEQEL